VGLWAAVGCGGKIVRVWGLCVLGLLRLSFGLVGFGFVHLRVVSYEWCCLLYDFCLVWGIACKMVDFGRTALVHFTCVNECRFRSM